ncbi:hypothetical protein [Micromonospora sp. ATCC 39149]|uniref:hypothetical protein n=1 Tax=Micromonospora sp. (strain ATCC 39149 / NRRL 15099 / SCC 1413) TaxID=219305 RepID=UPI0018DE637A|nr:hypothetical protein [Micromonospora sp. ATCC 39149]
MAQTGVLNRGKAAVRVNALLIWAAGCLRVVQLAVWIPVPLIGGLRMYRLPALVLAGYLLTVAWTVLLFVRAGRAGRMGHGWVYADVLVALLGLLLVPAACVASCDTGWQHWVLPPAMGAAIVAAAFAPRWPATAAVALLVAGYLVGSLRELVGSPDGFGAITVNAVSLLGFAVLAAVVAGYLRGSADQLDAATEAALAAGAREAAAQARFDERTRQYDALHRTVLTTLSMIAGAGWTTARRRCARSPSATPTTCAGWSPPAAAARWRTWPARWPGWSGTSRRWACRCTRSSTTCPTACPRTSSRP